MLEVLQLQFFKRLTPWLKRIKNEEHYKRLSCINEESSKTKYLPVPTYFCWCDVISFLYVGLTDQDRLKNSITCDYMLDATMDDAMCSCVTSHQMQDGRRKSFVPDYDLKR